MSSRAMAADERRWRAESDHRTLTEAAQIQADKGRMRDVAKHHKKVTKSHSLVGRTLMRGGRR